MVKTVLRTGALGLALTAGHAESIFPLVLGPELPKGWGKVTLRSEAVTSQSVEDGNWWTDGTYGHASVMVDGRQDVWQGEDTRVFITAGAGYRNLEGRMDLPLSGDPLPDSMQRVVVGTGVQFTTGNWNIATQFGIDSSTDRLFHSSDEVNLQFEGYARWQGSDQHALLLGLNWGFRNRLLAGGPLPVVAWHYTPDQEFSLVLGLPVVGVRWMPDPTVMVLVNAIPGVYDGLVTWRPFTETGEMWHKGITVGVHAGSYGWRGLDHDRPDDDYEISYSDYRAGLMAGLFLGPTNRISLEGGYAFGRTLREGEARNIFKDDDDIIATTVDIDDGPYISLTVGWSW